MAKSTISTILKNKEAIKVTNVVKGVKTLASKRSPAVEEVEKLLLVWISENQVPGDRMSEAIIYEKARHLYSGSSPKKNRLVVMLMNYNCQLVDSRWKKGNSPFSEQ
jgi:hypothetical protein